MSNAQACECRLVCLHNKAEIHKLVYRDKRGLLISSEINKMGVAS